MKYFIQKAKTLNCHSGTSFASNRICALVIARWATPNEAISFLDCRAPFHFARNNKNTPPASKSRRLQFCNFLHNETQRVLFHARQRRAFHDCESNHSTNAERRSFHYISISPSEQTTFVAGMLYFHL